MSLQEFLFYVIAGLTCLSAIGVVVSGNIVRQAAWLLFTLAGVSGLFFMLGAEFVGATQLLVYVGGTLVLVIFGVMLTAQGPFITMKNSAGEWAISTVVGLLFFGVLATALAVSWPTTSKPSVAPGEEMTSTTTLGLGLLGVSNGETGEDEDRAHQAQEDRLPAAV
jgi:NADH:ubiquinone oxidoreductase subunit 6 (subunit J)